MVKFWVCKWFAECLGRSWDLSFLGFLLLIFQNADVSLTTVTVTMPLGLTSSAQLLTNEISQEFKCVKLTVLFCLFSGCHMTENDSV